MMNTNLLDLNNDILNIIGDYVKKDNIDRIENFEKVDILYNILNRIGQVKRQKPIMRTLIANYFIYCVPPYLIIIIEWPQMLALYRLRQK